MDPITAIANGIGEIFSFFGDLSAAKMAKTEQETILLAGSMPKKQEDKTPEYIFIALVIVLIVILIVQAFKK